MKRYLFIFLVCFICVYFLTSGIFGVNGYVYNQNLKKQIYDAEYKKDRLEVEINSLQNKKSHLASEEGLRNLANDLGYYVDGDTVYLFDEPSLQDNSMYEKNYSENTSYKPLSSGSILLIDVCFSLVFSFIIWYLSKDSYKKEFFDDSDDDSDPEIYINA